MSEWSAVVRDVLLVLIALWAANKLDGLSALREIVESLRTTPLVKVQCYHAGPDSSREHAKELSRMLWHMNKDTGS